MTKQATREVLSEVLQVIADPAPKLAAAESKLKALQELSEGLHARIIAATEADDFKAVEGLLERKRSLPTELMLAEMQVHLARIATIEAETAALESKRNEVAAALDEARRVEDEAAAARVRLQNERAAYSNRQLDLAQRKGAERAEIDRLRVAIAVQR